MNEKMLSKGILERESLFQDVWSRPCLKIAADLGITSTALKKICIQMEIPTPKPGYWTLVQLGKKITKPKLSKATPSTKTTWTINVQNSQSQKGRKRQPRQISKDEKTLDSENYPEIKLPENLDDIHLLVRATRTQANEALKDIPWDQRKERKRLSMRVSKETMQRALIFYEAFVRGVESLGFRFRCELDEPPPKKDRYSRYAEPHRSGICWIQAGDEKIKFWMRELNQRIKITGEEAKKHWRDWKDIPSGSLEFNIDEPWGFEQRVKWKDGKCWKIESYLGEILSTLKPLQEYQRNQKILREQEEVRRKQEEAERQKIEHTRWRIGRQKDAENQVLECLLEKAQESNKTRLLRDFITEVQNKFRKEEKPIPENSPLDLFLRWAKCRADHMDPLKDDFEEWISCALKRIPGLGLEISEDTDA